MRVTILLLAAGAPRRCGERPVRAPRSISPGSGRRGSTTPTWISATTPASRSTRRGACRAQAGIPTSSICRRICAGRIRSTIGLRVSVSQLRITNELDPETRRPVGLRLQGGLAGARAGDLPGRAAASVGERAAQVVGIFDRALGAQHAGLHDHASQGGVSLTHRRSQEPQGHGDDAQCTGTAIS